MLVISLQSLHNYNLYCRGIGACWPACAYAGKALYADAARSDDNLQPANGYRETARCIHAAQVMRTFTPVIDGIK